MISEPISPPQMKLLLPRLADNDLAELVGWTAGLETRHACAAPRFCLWMAESVVAELKRRTSGGQVEAGSLALPAMGPSEVGLALIILSARTYAPQNTEVAAFFDEILRHVIALAAVQLHERYRSHELTHRCSDRLTHCLKKEMVVRLRCEVHLGRLQGFVL